MSVASWFRQIRVILLIAVWLGVSSFTLLYDLSGKPLSVYFSDEELPDFSGYKDAELRKTAFISFMLPKIQQVNRDIEENRARLQKLHLLYVASNTLSSDDAEWVIDMAREYGIPDPEGLDKGMWDELLKRVDIVPVALTLAQAAIETGWGTSRFAKEGNNMFGLWCFQEGCGLVPKRRASGKSHEVMAFSTVNDSVRFYVYNLNVNRAYQHFRELRSIQREYRQQLESHELALGLKNYSEIGDRYLRMIQSVISQNELDRFEQPS